MATPSSEKALASVARRKRALPVSIAVRPDDSPTATQIINATVALMAANGYHGTSVRDVAEAAGVSSAALYHYFDSKQGLLAVIMNRGIESLYERTQAALYAAPNNPADRLVAVVGVHVSRHLLAQREAFLGNTELRSLSSADRDVITSKRDQQQRLFDQIVLDGSERGTFTTQFPREASRAVVTMCSAVAGWYNPAGRLSADEIKQQYQTMGLATVGHFPSRSRKREKRPHS